ncbi:RNA-binding protein [Clostridium tetanomorphum]|uniref:RNA-binding protein n=1 Tax=Clostridium tetanomorphum TaxID=1553 RepID=A0A923E5A7_CLOTT|nr:YlmH/Sll1252 family protein [Clostridium tetanomorphum]MBC2396613.1 RNA-binding protein [Clostridium tetanomorphum]NRZ98237.1 RNA-binding protein YlmH [Clostridium tetanomorphum]
MIDKRTFISGIEYEDKNRISKLYDKILLCNKTGKTIYTNEFYPPNVWKKLEEFKACIDVNIYNNGFFEDSERRVIAFSSEEELYYYPVELIKVVNKSAFRELSHREYMGAIMSLGIRREKFGDIILKKDGCYFPINEELVDYVIDNLKNVGNCPCNIEKVNIYEEGLPQYTFENITVMATSNRIDCMISAITNLSRNKALDLILSGKVLINYFPVKDKDKMIKKNSIITVRGFGKFKFVEEVGNTAKGRLKLLFKKFI